MHLLRWWPLLQMQCPGRASAPWRARAQPDGPAASCPGRGDRSLGPWTCSRSSTSPWPSCSPSSSDSSGASRCGIACWPEGLSNQTRRRDCSIHFGQLSQHSRLHLSASQRSSTAVNVRQPMQLPAPECGNHSEASSYLGQSDFPRLPDHRCHLHDTTMQHRCTSR